MIFFEIDSEERADLGTAARAGKAPCHAHCSYKKHNHQKKKKHHTPQAKTLTKSARCVKKSHLLDNRRASAFAHAGGFLSCRRPGLF